MLGCSINLAEDLTANTHNYLLKMRNAGFEGVFTSLQAPEQTPEQTLKGLRELTKWCNDLGLGLVGDISKEGLKLLGMDAEADSIQKLGLTGVRIDAGFNSEEIAKLSQVMPVALNASTISESDILDLRAEHANFDHLEAWHNYYPRPNTGLDRNWFIQKNTWLKKYGFKVMAFVPGDSNLRGPIFAGLPTLEEHRNKSTFYAALDLLELGVDLVYIGDNDLSAASLEQFVEYLDGEKLLFHLREPIAKLSEHTWHQRADLSRDVIRLEEGRKLNLFQKLGKLAPRKRGCITSDNERYLRYEGELEIIKTDLPADTRVDVIGQILERDMDLLELVKAGQTIEFK
ncbi:MupG family TIM beta-alpha barrel fold protein [Lactobacillus psittaci]|uniref:Outer surface protein n=1 Tax=Lactobacillus psittaci DSM 15354 TaxID=1122152 RepID=A0A0R1S729_9LACO|nr:MupG family TIM beta-alpha barrel fold protein [Lactobacillus psittaci]KRL63332.1 hypothetical protein FC23_GL000902 [Lactobacillus psittaci DSM 15354]